METMLLWAFLQENCLSPILFTLVLVYLIKASRAKRRRNGKE